MTAAKKSDSTALEADDVAIAERYTVWSKRKRRLLSFMLGYLCLASSLTSTIYFPLIDLLPRFPAIWSPLSDTWGRRLVYLAIFGIFTAASLGLWIPGFLHHHDSHIKDRPTSPRRLRHQSRYPHFAPRSEKSQSDQMAHNIHQHRKSWKNDTRWLYKNLDRQKCLRTIAPAGLEPCDEPVTSEEEVKVLGTFCWTAKKTVRVPGGEPVFRNLELPVVLPPAPNLKAAGKIKTMPHHLLAPLAEAITTMSPSHSLRSTDLIVSRNSLRKLFALCAGRTQDSFRIGLHLINDTLIMTKDDRFLWHPGVTRSEGVGLSFENLFAKPLPGREGDQSHHRVLSYNLGDLRCVVQFEVDACYYEGGRPSDEAQEVPTADEDLAGAERLRLLSLGPAASLPTDRDATAAAASGQTSPHPVAPQSAIAEMKTTNLRQKLNEALPQLWFGRTPWFIQGFRNGDTITKVEHTSAADGFAKWEQKHQDTLRRVVSCVRELRETLRAAGPANKHCVLVYDKGAQGEEHGPHRVVWVFRSNMVQEPMSKEMLEKLWGLG
ncbi:hypothetical protein PspLS_07118 [Pyricularia sp. CBS 133598]|nr:hypothetical protein PspLS_07118 [Pyricularia sp. CBS 133598]